MVHDEVVIDIGGAMLRCTVLEIKTLLAYPSIAEAARFECSVDMVCSHAVPNVIALRPRS